MTPLTNKRVKFGGKVRGVILVFVAVSAFNACRPNQIADNPKYQELEKLWKEIPLYSGFVEGKLETTSTELKSR
jgi:hypothetical protein